MPNIPLCGCRGKRRFPSRSRAHKEARSYRLRGNTPLRVYYCWRCCGWHVTSDVEKECPMAWYAWLRTSVR